MLGLPFLAVGVEPFAELAQAGDEVGRQFGEVGEGEGVETL